jgi:hypothetical protein
MQQRSADVYVAGNESGSDAYELEHPTAPGSRGQLRSVAVGEGPEIGEQAKTSHPIRKGAVWGALAGLLLGTTALLASVVVGAGVGALVGKASQLRIEKGSAPRIRFGQSRH